MRRSLPVILLCLAFASSAEAQGLLIPTQTDVPPLSMSSHQVKVMIEDQVALTHVTQTFRNASDRALEATYIFSVPKSASVKKFIMWVDGKEVPGELVEADKARQIYTDVVRRTQDPGLLESMGNDLLRVRVFPVPARGEQKLAVSYTSVAPSDGGLIEYIYPLKADGKTSRGLEKFAFEATLKGQHPIQNVYSPTHAVTVTRSSDRQAVVRFEGKQETLDKDFQLYFTAAAKDVGLTALMHRPTRAADGHFMMLIAPRAELARTQQVARDMVFVLDTSGSMAGKRIEQARKALKFCLRNLNSQDRFAVIHFATIVTQQTAGLVPASAPKIAEAQRWVDRLEAVGSTNIDEALAAALALRGKDAQRNFTIVFFTDGQPTVGETNPENIVKNVVAKNSANTRIFTFGVGDDVNAVLLDRLAEKTRSVSTYVRETEDIEAKVSSFYGKISHPVLTDLKVTVDLSAEAQARYVATQTGPIVQTVFIQPVRCSEIYPRELPDLFHGTQLVVLGRYQNSGKAKVTLTGMVGDQRKEFEYEVTFPAHTGNDRAFVEDLWARRKVGYLLDQIRSNGQSKELVDEVVALAKKHGITTPYTSYLVVPDAVAGTPVASMPPLPVYDPPSKGSPRIQFAPVFVPPTMQWAVPNSVLGPPSRVVPAPTSSPVTPATTGTTTAAPPLPLEPWQEYYRNHGYSTNIGLPPIGAQAPSQPGVGGLVASGKDGVDLALQLGEMRNQNQVGQALVRQANGRKCLHINGVWMDEGFDAKLTVVKIKAQSPAYFRILERQPTMREVFQLGNQVVWITPSGTALVIEPNQGSESLSDAAIDRLFVAKK